MPPAFIRLPVRMKKGMARRVKPVVLEYILAGSMHKTLVSPSTTKKITAVKPMEKAIGSPIKIRNINTPKMAAVIMAISFQIPVDGPLRFLKLLKIQAGVMEVDYTRLFILFAVTKIR
jgi:hypothetical protein